MLTLEEKYTLALQALREIAEVGRKGCNATSCLGSSDVAFYDGKDAGLEAQGETASYYLNLMGED